MKQACFSHIATFSTAANPDFRPRGVPQCLHGGAVVVNFGFVSPYDYAAGSRQAFASSALIVKHIAYKGEGSTAAANHLVHHVTSS